MICPECEQKLTRGETLCKCGWRKGPATSEWAQKFEKLPACSRCSSTGIPRAPYELDSQAVSIAEDRDRVPVHPFTRGLWLCTCPRGQMRRTLHTWKLTPVLTSEHEQNLNDQYGEDVEWWQTERAQLGLVVRPDPAADRQALRKVMAAGGRA